jgi:hypothetical protein
VEVGQKEMKNLPVRLQQKDRMMGECLPEYQFLDEDLTFLEEKSVSLLEVGHWVLNKSCPRTHHHLVVQLHGAFQHFDS